MPRPLYIICSESGSQDKLTGITSIFNIIDRITVTMETSKESPPDVGLPAGAKAFQLLSFTATVAWQAFEEDMNQEFEHKTVFRFTPKDKEKPEQVQTVAEGRFTFTQVIHRFIGYGRITHKTPGLMVVESSIRKIGETEWMTQDYPIPVNVTSLEKAAASP